MPTPDKPSLDYSYTAFQEAQGNNSFPGARLDNDLANLKQSIDETIDFTSQVIRSDGALQNGVVTKASLSADILSGIAAPHPWATATAYEAEATVTTDNGLYLCLVAHTSGDFAADFAAGQWDQLAVWSPLTEVADNTISTAKLQNLAVTGAKVAENTLPGSKMVDGSIPRAKTAANFGLMPIGGTLPWDGPFAPAGWLFKFGQAVSRATYIDTMNALTAAVVGNVANASPTVSGVSVDLRGLGLEGSPIEGPGVSPGTTVASVTINTIVLSANATAPGTGVQLRIFPHGNGDGSTTFNIPNDRDIVEIGRGTMGGTARGLVTTTGAGTSGLDTGRLGAVGGVDRHTLTEVQLASHTHAANVTDPGHSHSSGNLAANLGVQFQTGTTATPAAQTSGSVNGAPTGISVTNGYTGGGQAHPNVQPSRVTNKIIFTGVV